MNDGFRCIAADHSAILHLARSIHHATRLADRIPGRRPRSPLPQSLRMRQGADEHMQANPKN